MIKMQWKLTEINSFNEMIDETASWQNDMATMKPINPVVNVC